MSEMSESPRGASVGTPGGRPLRVLLTTDWWEPVVNGVVASVTTLRRELPGTAILSIAHRPAVARYHDRVLRLSEGRLIPA